MLLAWVDPLGRHQGILRRAGRVPRSTSGWREGRPAMSRSRRGTSHGRAVRRPCWRGRMEGGRGWPPARDRARPVPSEGCAGDGGSRSHRDEAWLDSFLTGTQNRATRPDRLVPEVVPDRGGRSGSSSASRPTMEWDTAAAQAVLEAAGGAVRNLDGSPLRYGKPGLTNPALRRAALVGSEPSSPRHLQAQGHCHGRTTMAASPRS